MHSITIKPNHRKLTECGFVLSIKEINALETGKGLNLDLEYFDEARYNQFSTEFAKLISEYNLGQHHDELLFVILTKQEGIMKRYEAYILNYNDDVAIRDFSKFLLMYLQASDDDTIELKIKVNGKYTKITNTPCSKWTMDIITQAILAKSITFASIGEKLFYDLFHEEFNLTDQELKLKLAKMATRTLQAPHLKFKYMTTELLVDVREYLIDQTHLTTPNNILLTNEQSRFLFGLLSALQFIDKDKPSVPVDYMHTTFHNFIKKYVPDYVGTKTPSK